MSFTRGARQRNGFPKPGEELKDVPGRHTRDGWVHITDHQSTYIEGKQYKHMREWSKPCAICGAAVQTFEKIGTVDANSRFSNRTCKDHRGLLPAFEKGFLAWDKDKGAIAAGAACTGAVAVAGGELAEVTKERDEAWERGIELMTERGELIRKYETVFAELQPLKAKLAKYELPAAMAAQEKLPWG